MRVIQILYCLSESCPTVTKVNLTLPSSAPPHASKTGSGSALRTNLLCAPVITPPLPPPVCVPAAEREVEWLRRRGRVRHEESLQPDQPQLALLAGQCRRAEE